MERADWPNSIIRERSIAARWNIQVKEKKDRHTIIPSGKPGECIHADVLGTVCQGACTVFTCSIHIGGKGWDIQVQKAAAPHWPWAWPFHAMASNGQLRHHPGFLKTSSRWLPVGIWPWRWGVESVSALSHLVLSSFLLLSFSVIVFELIHWALVCVPTFSALTRQSPGTKDTLWKDEVSHLCLGYLGVCLTLSSL